MWQASQWIWTDELLTVLLTILPHGSSWFLKVPGISPYS